MNVYEIVTKEILAKLEQEIVPWQMPWKRKAFDHNGVSKRRYRGVNTILTSMRGFAESDWYTLRQMRELGVDLKENQHSSIVCFYKVIEKEPTETEKKMESMGFITLDDRKHYMLRYYGVFNREQIDGLPELPKTGDELDFKPVEACEKVIEEFRDRPSIEYGGARAFYSPMQDIVKVPKRENFISIDEYYSTLFHELVHSTGHEKRTGRTKDGHDGFGGKEYAREELCAEIGSAILCRHCGITKTIDNSVSYIDNWKKALLDDAKCVVLAAQRAQRAVDYILNIKNQQEEA